MKNNLATYQDARDDAHRDNRDLFDAYLIGILSARVDSEAWTEALKMTTEAYGPNGNGWLMGKQ